MSVVLAFRKAVQNVTGSMSDAMVAEDSVPIPDDGSGRHLPAHRSFGIVSNASVRPGVACGARSFPDRRSMVAPEAHDDASSTSLQRKTASLCLSLEPTTFARASACSRYCTAHCCAHF
jgi:hypothetical protein